MAHTDREELGEWLSAYLDGEVSADEAALIEKTLAKDEEARRLLDDLRATASGMGSLPRHAAPQSILEDVRFRLERDELLSDRDEAAASPGRGSFGRARWVMAATLGLVTVGALWILVDRYETQRSQIVAIAPPQPSDPMVDEAEEAAPRGERDGRALDDAGISARIEKGGRYAVKSDGNATPKARERIASGKRKSSRRRAPVLVEAPMAGFDDADSMRARADRNGRAGPSRPAPRDFASFDQRLAQGAGAAELKNHVFSNETVRIEIRAIDEASRDRIERQIQRGLGELQVADVSTMAPTGVRSSALYVAGRAGVNFDDGRRRQYLMRMPAPEVAALVGGLDVADQEVALSLNQFRFEGTEQVTSILQSVGQPHGRQPAEVEGELYDLAPAVADASEPPGSQAFEDLVDAFGLKSITFEVPPRVAGQTTALATDSAEPPRTAGVEAEGVDARRGEAAAIVGPIPPVRADGAVAIADGSAARTAGRMGGDRGSPDGTLADFDPVVSDASTGAQPRASVAESDSAKKGAAPRSAKRAARRSARGVGARRHHGSLVQKRLDALARAEGKDRAAEPAEERRARDAHAAKRIGPVESEVDSPRWITLVLDLVVAEPESEGTRSRAATEGKVRPRTKPKRTERHKKRDKSTAQDQQ